LSNFTTPFYCLSHHSQISTVLLSMLCSEFLQLNVVRQQLW